MIVRMSGNDSESHLTPRRDEITVGKHSQECFRSKWYLACVLETNMI